MHIHGFNSARATRRHIHHPPDRHFATRRGPPAGGARRAFLPRSNSFDLALTELGQKGLLVHTEEEGEQWQEVDSFEAAGMMSMPPQAVASGRRASDLFRSPSNSPRGMLSHGLSRWQRESDPLLPPPDNLSLRGSLRGSRELQRGSPAEVQLVEHTPWQVWSTSAEGNGPKGPPLSARSRGIRKNNKMSPRSVPPASQTESWLEAPVTEQDLTRRRLMAPLVSNGYATSATPLEVLKIQQERACRHCPHCKKLLPADLTGEHDITRSVTAPAAREHSLTRYSSDRQRQSAQEEEGPPEPELEPLAQSSIDTQERRQWYSPQLKFRLLCALGLLWLVSGLAFFVSMGYHFVDAMYSMAQILTTVGYGDIVPEKPHEKLVTAFIVLSSTLLMAGLVSHMIDVFLDAQAQMLEERLRAKEEQIKAGQTNDHNEAWEEASKLSKLKTQGLVQTLTFTVFVVIGTLFYALVEPCSCSYGKTLIPDCVPENCFEKGEVKTYVDAFYMCIITISTVGYGDLTPQSQMGRLFGTFWMLFGVGSIINLVGTVTDLLKEVVDSGERMRMTQDMFHKMDTNFDGQLDKYEFMRLQLVMLGLAQEDELASIETQFELIDESGDGNISLEEFRNFYL